MVSSPFLLRDDMINFQVADLEVGGATCAMALLLAIKQRSILWAIVTGEFPQVSANRNISADWALKE